MNPRDLKLLVDAYLAGNGGVVITEPGFESAKTRLRRRDYIEQDPFNDQHVRITSDGARVVDEICQTLAHRR